MSKYIYKCWMVVFFTTGPVVAFGQSQVELFEQLKSLNGVYQAASEESEYAVSYKLVAKGSALMETWFPGTENEEITLFHMDNGQLVATHYCGAGSQVTMGLTWPNEVSRHLEFKIKSVTNLPSPDTAHNSGFAYTFNQNDDETDTIIREEVWLKAGELSSSFLTLTKQER